MSKPLIGITACVKRVVGESLPFHAAPDPYVMAVAVGADAVPVIVPALGEGGLAVLEHLDGLVFSGSKSNLDPALYGGEAAQACPPFDPRRDATTLPLLRAALARGLPVLAICRGLQEMNVALGGTLHQRVHDQPGLADHRSRGEDSVEEQFAPSHAVTLEFGGLLAGLAGGLGPFRVNSLHGQGIARLAPGLAVEARAPDGLVEAVRVIEAASLALGVQWHPEWNIGQDSLSAAIFRKLGDAARHRQAAYA